MISPEKLSRRSVLGLAGLGVLGLAAGAVLRNCGKTKETVKPFPKPLETPEPLGKTIEERLWEKAGETIANLNKTAETHLKTATASYFRNSERTGQVARLRKLIFSDSTSDSLNEMYQKNPESLHYPMPTHPGILIEFGFISYLAKMEKDRRLKLLEAYADGLIDGLGTAYQDKINSTFVVALEAGHMSVPPFRIPSDDARPDFPLLEGGVINEKDLNLQLCQLAAIKLMERRLKWIPVLNSDENGYPVKKLISSGDNRINVIDAYSAIFPMKYKWDQFALRLKSAGIGMVRVAAHFDVGTHNYGRDGMVIVPRDDDKNGTNRKLAEKLAPAIQTKARVFIPGYKCKVNLDYDRIQGPLVTLHYGG